MHSYSPIGGFVLFQGEVSCEVCSRTTGLREALRLCSEGDPHRGVLQARSVTSCHFFSDFCGVARDGQLHFDFLLWKDFVRRVHKVASFVHRVFSLIFGLSLGFKEKRDHVESSGMDKQQSRWRPWASLLQLQQVGRSALSATRHNADAIPWTVRKEH